jgi:hypothetical protein
LQKGGKSFLHPFRARLRNYFITVVPRRLRIQFTIVVPGKLRIYFSIVVPGKVPEAK